MEDDQNFIELVRQLMRWLDNNCNPHTTIIIDSMRAEIMVGEKCVVRDETIDPLKD